MHRFRIDSIYDPVTGQQVRISPSGVRVTDVATGVFVECKNEGSQKKNADKAILELEKALELIKQEN